MFSVLPVGLFPVQASFAIPKSPPLNPLAPIFHHSEIPDVPFNANPLPPQGYPQWVASILQEGELIRAIQGGAKNELIYDLITKSSPNALDCFINDTNALMESAKRLDIGLVTRLLKHGANPQSANKFMQTPLLFLIRFGDKASIFIPASDQTSSRSTQKSIADKMAENSRKILTIMQMLIDCGAYVDAVDSFGTTPLQAYVNQFFPEHVDPDVIALLVAEGADVERAMRREYYSQEVENKITKGIEMGLATRINAAKSVAITE